MLFRHAAVTFSHSPDLPAVGVAGSLHVSSVESTTRAAWQAALSMEMERDCWRVVGRKSCPPMLMTVRELHCDVRLSAVSEQPRTEVMVCAEREQRREERRDRKRTTRSGRLTGCRMTVSATEADSEWSGGAGVSEVFT